VAQHWIGWNCDNTPQKSWFRASLWACELSCCWASHHATLWTDHNCVHETSRRWRILCLRRWTIIQLSCQCWFMAQKTRLLEDTSI